MSHRSATTDRTARGLCGECGRALVRSQVLDGSGNVLNETLLHDADVWTDRACREPLFVLPPPVPLDDERLREIGNLIRHQSSVSFTSHRAGESVQAMQTALVAVRQLHRAVSVPTGGDDFMTLCASCGQDRDGGKPCTTLQALGQFEPDPE